MVPGWWRQCSHDGESMLPETDFECLWPQHSTFSASCSGSRVQSVSLLLLLVPVACYLASPSWWILILQNHEISSCFHQLLWSWCFVTTARRNNTVPLLASSPPSCLCLWTPVLVESSPAVPCCHFSSIIRIQLLTSYLLFGLD